MNERLGMEDSISMDFNTLTVVTNTTEPLAVGTGNIHTDVTQEQAERLVSQVEVYLKQVAEDAPGCCIDGRKCKHNLDGSPAELRPSVAGGPLITAYAAAELVGWFGEDDDSTLEERLDVVKNVLETNGVKLGAHVDEKAVANDYKNPETGAKATGCGADDKAPAIIAAIYDNDETVQKLTGAVLPTFDEKAMAFTSKEKVTARFASWDPKMVLDASTSEDRDNVEVLEKSHEEALVVFNYVEGTTIDRDALVEATGRQVFCVDMWYINKLARALASGPDPDEQYVRLQHAMTAYQIGTYLSLCDGTQRAVLLNAA
jgi:hypothetical protein